MSRWTIALVIAITVGAWASISEAQIHARFCASWQTDLSDAGFGEDALNVPGPLVRPAAYVPYRLWYRMGPTYPYSPISGGTFDIEGCTPYIVVERGQYRLCRDTKVVRSARITTLLPDGQDWEQGAAEHIETDWDYLNPVPDYYSFTAPPTPLTDHTRLVPIYARIMQFASTLDIPDGMDVRVSSDPVLCPNGSQLAGVYGSHYHLCLSNNHLDNKFVMAHEYGHAIARINNSLVGANAFSPSTQEYFGDEGIYEDTDADNRCDCDDARPGASHCLGSREFIGTGAREGFSHFLAAASFNNRNQNTGNGGFVYYDGIERHQTDSIPRTAAPAVQCPAGSGVCAAPRQIDVTDQYTWMNGQCLPPGGTYQHFGSEWDWLTFFYELWTDSADQFDISEINQVWDDVPDNSTAILCCTGAGPNPAGICTPSTMGAGCGATTNNHYVGKLWADLEAQSYITTGSLDMGDNFGDTGFASGVDH